MVVRREAGLCYNCEEKFTPGHRCKRLFLLLSPSEDDDSACEDNDVPNPPSISLYSLTGINPRAAQVMQLSVRVADTIMLALLDSGSTHNFITPKAARRAGISVQACNGFKVLVANGIASPALVCVLRCHLKLITYTVHCGLL